MGADMERIEVSLSPSGEDGRRISTTALAAVCQLEISGLVANTRRAANLAGSPWDEDH